MQANRGYAARNSNRKKILYDQKIPNSNSDCDRRDYFLMEGKAE